MCKDRVTLASTLLKIFRHEREEIFLLKTMNSLEIEKQGKVKVVINLLRFSSRVKMPKWCVRIYSCFGAPFTLRYPGYQRFFLARGGRKSLKT